MDQYNLNAPLPAVTSADVQALWRFMNMASPSRGNSSKGGEGAETYPSAVGFDRDLLAERCSAGADVNAVFFRTSLPGVLLRIELLSPWQHGAALSADVFQVEATLPIASLNEFDPHDFLAALGSANDLNQLI
jgi:hypothetical protein